MSNTHEHLEHIEHAEHAAHSASYLDRYVAITMAIVAAVLACVTLLSHRAHNDTLKYQLQASIAKTEANDEWAYYQAQHAREYQFRGFQALDAAMSKDPDYANDPEKKKLYEAGRKEWDKQLEKYKEELPEKQRHAKELDDKSKEYREESEHSHHLGDRFDLAELATEVSLVLCSLALLTKRPAFWYTGIGTGLLGVAAALTVLFLH